MSHTEKGQKVGLQHDMDKMYFDAKQSKAKKFEGMFSQEIMVIKRLLTRSHTYRTHLL